MARQRERNVTLSCVTFTVVMLVCLSGWSFCFGVGCHFSSHAFHCPSPISTLVSNNHPENSSTPLTFLFLFSPPPNQWCERNKQCQRLQLRDLLVAPLQKLTRYPLLLRNIAKRCQMEDETKGVQTIAEHVDTSICEQDPP